MDKIWWKQITKANSFVRKVAGTVLENQNVLLSVPPRIPWRGTMVELVDGILREENPAYRLEFIECPEEEVGKYLLEHYCKKETRSAYRYGMTYASFLARNEGTVLSSRYLWVKNIPASKLGEWAGFLQEYRKCFPKNGAMAVFILETVEDGTRRRAYKGLQLIGYDDWIDAYDKFAFCTLACTDAEIKPYLKPYIAELVSNICKDDMELCAACIRHVQEFLRSPSDTLQQIGKEETHADGTPFYLRKEREKLEIRVWESQVKLLFPVIERYRSAFVSRKRDDIRLALPIKNSYGEEITEPLDVELGSLIFLVGLGKLRVTDREYRQLDTFRTARNNLAHLKALGFSEVDAILSQRL